MVPGVPTVGVCFDIELLGGGASGFNAWKIFWGAIDPKVIAKSTLHDGGTHATLQRRENVYCIAVQCPDPRTIEKVKTALRNDDRFRKVAAPLMFAEGSACVREPLVDCGRIDAAGNFGGDDSHARAALAAVRKQRAGTAPAPKRRPGGTPARRPWWKFWG